MIDGPDDDVDFRPKDAGDVSDDDDPLEPEDTSLTMDSAFDQR